MNPAVLATILLPSPLAHDYYSVFYLLGFGVAGALLLWEGQRRQYPLRPWLLVVAGSSLLLILGTKLVTLSGADWQQLWQHGLSQSQGQRSVLGGLLGATLGLAGLRRWLGFGRGVFDAFALPFIIGLAVQGLGCLLTGCCFGTAAPDHLPWAVQYAPGTLPFVSQVEQDLLSVGAAHSAAVHPSQLYQILLCLGIAAVLFRTRRQSWPAGTRFLLMLGLYAAGRFGLEFWRAPLGDVIGAGSWHGVKPVQLALLLVAAGLLGFWAWVVRRPRAGVAAEPVSASRPARTLAGAVALLALTAGLGEQWLSLPEQLVVQALLLPVVALEACFLLFSANGGWGQLVVRGGLAALFMLLTSQVPAPPDSTVAAPRRAYTSISLGGSAGSSTQYYETPYYGCSGTPYPVSKYRQRYTLGSLGVAHTLPVGRAGTLTLGLSASIGRSQFRSLQDTIVLYNSQGNFNTQPFEQGQARLYAVSPYVELVTSPYMRIGLGMHLGNVAYDFAYRPGELSQARPQFLFEIGKPSVLYFHTSMNYGLLGLGDGTNTMGVGSGFGQENFRLTGGLALSNSKWQGVKGADTRNDAILGFFQSSVLLNQQWELEPLFVTNLTDVYRFSLQTRYRLPSRTR
ncbi:prolipoprotein diacylglyceryl transferase family protein [Hymenobacter cellulosilyticus]|uniref:Prolipoprotein diacylglyceryl transferase n=1 Tax=Hymenobacter cellulosilyticus TaxID=2932248 RepID=A0A8T9PXF3_9BACT|nr:prolipoprotein diacylglyceryl transferase family protein [Hymenobacter cellulosilyticus]UOQ70056.1 prolipoprotein diacylglyceryl transferase [Hymenobacter cellulosilyticus]